MRKWHYNRCKGKIRGELGASDEVKEKKRKGGMKERSQWLKEMCQGCPEGL